MGNINAKDPDYWNVPESPPYSNKSWMAGLPDSKSLCLASIPGTHDTMARVSDLIWSWCQAWSLNDQMDVGIRFFDIRCRHFRNGLPIHHDLIYQNCNFNDCVSAMIQFLDSNPSEVLIMRVKEEYDAAENTNTFADAVKDIIPCGRPERFWMNNSIPTVGEARGKIVILQNFYCKPAIGGVIDISLLDMGNRIASQAKYYANVLNPAKDPDYWNVPEPPSSKYINRNWMARLPDTQCLSRISIPGTHNTMARARVFLFGLVTWCQAWSLKDQMDVGIRFFDIRCRHYRNGLQIHHGPIDQHCNFKDVVKAMTEFLDSNPSEVLIMRVKEENENTNTFADAVKEIIPCGKPDRFWMKTSIPTVGEARGKIVILQDFPCKPAIGIRYSDLDKEDTHGLGSTESKWPKVEEHLQHAKASIQEGRNKMFLTFSSFSGKLTIPRGNAGSMNPKLHKFVRDKRGPFGIIAMDYPGPKLVQDIIEGNF